MSNKQLETKYADILRRLHTCGPAEKSALMGLLNYYYFEKQKRGI